MLRYKTETTPGLVALYNIRPGNGAGHYSYNPGVEHSDSGEKNSIRFGSIHADESIFRFDSTI